MAHDRPHLPREAVDLYTRYIHGEIKRRDFLSGLSRFAIAGLTVNAIVDALMPDYVSAQQVSKTDERITASYVSVPSPQGNGSIKGYLVRPANASATAKVPVVLVVHENRGLNPYVEDVARRLGTANFMAFAPDALTSVGGYPGDDEKGGALFGKVDRPKMTEDFVAAAAWLKARPESTGKLGVVGFCFGGGIANTLAVRMPDLAAAVPFYGGPPADADVPKIKAAVQAHHGELDTRLAEGWPAYDKALTAANVPHEGFIYPKANHGFHNDTTPRYDEAAAKLAWTRTIGWFNKYLRST